MVEFLGKLALTVLDIFIADKKKKEEYARNVMASLARWDREALKSAELRDMFKRIEQKARESQR